MTMCFGVRTRSAGFILAMSAMMPMAAQAADGTITIAGEITDTTCLINGAAPPANFRVQLPKISSGALPAGVGSTAGAVVFPITLTNCPEALNGEVRAHFEPGASVKNYEKGWLHAYRDGTAAGAVTPTATALPNNLNAVGNPALENVGIRIANLDGTDISIGQTDTATPATLVEPSPVTDPVTRGATLRYLASYVRTGDGAVSAGRVVSYIQYSIAYP